MNKFWFLGEGEPLRLIGILAAALATGLGVGFYLSRPDAKPSSKPDAPIEWNQVQSVPMPAPDAEDKKWQERADALDEPAPSAGLHQDSQNQAQ